jgi:hypothetical protein
MAESFNPQGNVKVFWVSSTLTTSAPTATQINAGLDLTCAIMTDGVAGFAREPQYVDATPLCATAERTVAGLATTTNGALTLLRGSTSDSDNSALLDDLVADIGTEGHIVFVLGDVATGTHVDIFPSTIASVNAQPLVGRQAARYVVGFSHQGDFILNEVIAS